jgi:hypothetical protein
MSIIYEPWPELIVEGKVISIDEVYNVLKD